MQIHWWYWSVSGQHLYISPELIELLGYSEEEYDGGIPTIDRNLHPEDIKEHEALFSKLISGELDYYEKEFRLKIDNRWHWFYNRGAVVARDERGNPLMVGGISMDVSQRYNQILNRIEEGSKFEFIFHHTQEAVIILEAQQGYESVKVVDANKAAGVLYGCDHRELIGMDPRLFGNRGMKKSGNKLFEQILEDETISFETELINWNKEKKNISVYAHMFSLTGRQLILVMLDDMTGWKEMEHELRESENLYRSVIQSANDRIGVFGLDGSIVLTNAAFYESLGYSKEEYFVRENREKVHPDDVAYIDEKRNELLENGTASSEYRVQHKDGHYLHMSSKSVLLHEGDDKQPRVLMVVRDTSGLMKVQQELLEAKQQAEESDKLKSAFLANMSHEIRTPMNSIVGFANLLSELDLDASSRKEYAQRINRNSVRLIALISDIIDLAKIESNQLPIVFSTVHLPNLFRELNQVANEEAGQRRKEQLEISYDPDPGHPDLAMETDMVRLMQIMQNLVNNAIKFTDEGVVGFGYRLRDDNRVQFFVSDTGIGIDKKDFDIIFDQFRQVEDTNTRTHGGTGLGLAISRNLVRMLGGRIWLESEVGKGSVFYVELPLDTGVTLDHTGKRAGDEEPVDVKGLQILVVDDDTDSVTLLQEILAGEGVETFPAYSGYEALVYLDSERMPDVILMDLQMPILTGEQTFRIIREKYPGAKIIAQSAYALQGDRDRFLALGFDEYFSKPYVAGEIITLISRVAGK